MMKSINNKIYKLMKELVRCKYYMFRKIHFLYNKKRAKRLGIHFTPPNYIYLDRLNSKSLVVDVGCSDDPDFSEFVMNKYKCQAYGVDPTRKHFACLERITNKYNGHNGLFIHLPYAVANIKGKITFYESKTNTSGSIELDHANVINDEVVSYDVDAIVISQLKEIVGSKIDFLKLDLEGAEYDLLDNVAVDDFKNIDQVFIEFHHHCINSHDYNDTKRMVDKVKGFGFKSFTMDRHNFLFYR
jgi:FkbM family methyltransferase